MFVSSLLAQALRAGRDAQRGRFGRRDINSKAYVLLYTYTYVHDKSAKKRPAPFLNTITL